MGTMRHEGRGQRSGLRACEGRTVVLQRFKLKWKKGKKKKKKKTQLGLGEQVSSWAAMTRVGDEQPGWRVRKETPSWPVVLVLCAGKEVYVWQKKGKGVAGKGVEQVVKVVKGFKLKQWGTPSHAMN